MSCSHTVCFIQSGLPKISTKLALALNLPGCAGVQPFARLQRVCSTCIVLSLQYSIIIRINKNLGYHFVRSYLYASGSHNTIEMTIRFESCAYHLCLPGKADNNFCAVITPPGGCWRRILVVTNICARLPIHTYREQIQADTVSLFHMYLF